MEGSGEAPGDIAGATAQEGGSHHEGLSGEAVGRDGNGKEPKLVGRNFSSKFLKCHIPQSSFSP